MQSQELIIYKAAYWKCIERLHEQFVRFLIVLVQALCSKVEELRHLATLVVPSQHVDGGGIVQLEGVEEEDHLAGEGTAVYVVAKEEVFCL